MAGKKVIRMNYWGQIRPDEPNIVLLNDPGEVRIGVGTGSFLSIKEDGISFSGGTPSKVSIQSLPQSTTYAGMVQNIPFPMSLIPITPANPMPQQVMNPPFKEMVSIMKELAVVANSLVGI